MDKKDFIISAQNLGRHFPKASQFDNLDKEPLKIAITGAAGQIGSFLCHFIAQGRMFGPYQKVILHLIELPFAEKLLNGMVMEIQDSAYRCVAGIVPTIDVTEGFTGIDVAILLGAKPRGPGMERKDLLQQNASIFETQGKILDQYAKKTVKVLVVGNPCNTNALIASSFAPSIPKKNFTAMTRLDQLRASNQISQKTGVHVENIENIIIWGNHSTTQYPDTFHARINGENLRKVISDDEYLNNEFIQKVQQRGAEIISVMQKSSAASAAAAVCEHMHDWWFGNQDGGYVSMGVISEQGQYGIDGDLCFSYPCNVKNGEWEIVQDLDINEFSKQKLLISEKELQEERLIALGR